MYKRIVVLLLLSGFNFTSQASYLLSSPSINIDFSEFQGSGFASSPTRGQLDSDVWRLSGLSQGDTTYGGLYDSGDYARGVSSGGVTTGGMYAFDMGGDIALGVQATAGDFTPGTIALRVANDTGNTIDELQISYDLYLYNNSGRSSDFSFAYSLQPQLSVDVTDLGIYSEGVAASSPQWVRSQMTTQLTDMNLLDGEFLELLWYSADRSGSGGRDEFALDNISISRTATVPTPGGLPLFIGGLALLGFRATSENKRAKIRKLGLSLF